MWQQRILLAFIKAMNFIHKQDGLLAILIIVLLGLLNGFSNFFNSGKDG